MRPYLRPVFSALLLSLTILPFQAQARAGRGGFGSPYDPIYSPYHGPTRTVRQADSREGKVKATQFIGDGTEGRLGAGEVQIRTMAGSTPNGHTQPVYEAAMLDQLGKAGYNIAGAGKDAGQVAGIVVTRDVAEPAEVKKSPVSGIMAVGVSNRGISYGMAVNVDMTEPRTALLFTRMTLRISDTATDEILWEGRAEMWTRDEDADWTEADIASRLSAALLEGFPAPHATLR